ncbi:TPA: DUF4956 domain-containing protein [Streptococcus equi subsp. zooepidemicus]|uniref:DUF4956 domain-containing protein n=1 Tax=Streptococcus equi subsp. zooepidemicus (strain MGCS10565) TaxID=552526 RepID=B4U2G6_STREM|nr:DUF4956 domain-containing protein [Streptococcus equi]ACG62183.1 hypothetical protein Sez_0824 [Streptococcus equi subsp. zooepidemicus MGCS10565]MDI5988242.1 DUF4956 domain-containing protein [Streptococcus equi subsp. zooepidemicus]MDI6035477.1 DUF4956 domain-containing protein [Streptococcus equi subsp. zooepidemicus]QZA21726.1 DUF4956 domain-containing protein [Streptococcus equi subsp. zooepidemicus]SQF53875.1 membrane protein [Streptococcus equi subsp. zooepidemicus]
MKQLLRHVFEQRGTLSFQDVLLHIVAAALLSIVIYMSYAYTHTGTAYSKKFNVSLMTLTVLTATVMTVIGNNVALSLGMVGALSVVRFRTAIKDSRDTVYIFWTIVVGICCGVGDYTVAATGSSVIFLLLLLMGAVRNDNRLLLIVRCDKQMEIELERLVFNYFSGKAIQRVKNTTSDDIEMIFELSRKDYDSTYQQANPLTEAVYQLGRVDYFNIVSQSDDITG